MEPQFQSPVSSQTGQKRPNILFLIGIFALLLIILAVWGFTGDKEAGRDSEDSTQTVVDLATVEGRDKLPEGFPEEIPIEIEGVVESYTTTYSDSKVTVHTVSYRTSRDQMSVFDEYLTFVSQRGFQIYTMSDKPDTKSLYAQKGNTDFSFSISRVGVQSLVHLSYIIRS